MGLGTGLTGAQHPGARSGPLPYLICSMAAVGFEWLDEALDRLRGIQPYEVLQGLSSTRRWPRAGHLDALGLAVLIVWCRTNAGRPLIVVTRPVRGWDYQILGAREMTADEVKQFEKWEADRND
jgi:hypothetical protein